PAQCNPGRSSGVDAHHGGEARREADASVAAEHRINSGIPGIGEKPALAQRHDLLLARKQDDTVAALDRDDPAGDLRPDLLIAAAEAVALATDDAEDDARRVLRDEGHEIGAGEVAADELAVAHGVDTEQAAFETDMIQHAPGRRARTEDIEHTRFHFRRD